jgi:hypothetical protein
MRQLLFASALFLFTAVAHALPMQIDCQNQTKTTAYREIKVRHISSGGVYFAQLEIEKDAAVSKDWVDGPTGYFENNVRTYYGDNLVFTVQIDGPARLRLITLLPDGKYQDTYEDYLCTAAQ